MIGVDIEKIAQLAPSPAYVLLGPRCRHNLAILDQCSKHGAKILMALKAFSCGVHSRGSRTLHVSVPAHLRRAGAGGVLPCGTQLAAAFKESDVVELLSISNHLVFNSFNQLERFRPLWEKEQGRVSIGLRVNPEHSEGHTAIYDPCAPTSRLGIPVAEFEGRSLEGVGGFPRFQHPLEHCLMTVGATAGV